MLFITIAVRMALMLGIAMAEADVSAKERLDGVHVEQSSGWEASIEAILALGAMVFILGLREYHYYMGRGSAAKKSKKKIDKIGYDNCTADTKLRCLTKDVHQTARPATPDVPELSPEVAKSVEERARLSEVVISLAKKGDVYRATKSLAHLEERFGHASLAEYSTIISTCAKGGDATNAQRWLRRLLEVGLTPTTICFNAVINVVAKQGDIQHALILAKEMKKRGLEFDTVTYNTFIDASARAGDAVRAQQWMNQMLAAGVKASVVSFGSVMRSCAQAGLIEELELWIAKARELGIELNMICFSAIINAFAKSGDVKNATAWLTRMICHNVDPTIHCFSGVLTAVLSTGDIERTLEILKDMQKATVRPDAALMSNMITIAVDRGLHAHAQNWAHEAISNGHQLSRAAGTALTCAGLLVPNRHAAASAFATCSVPEPATQEQATHAKLLGRRSSVGKRFIGTIKEFVPGKFGYICCEDTNAIYRRDIYLCHVDNPEQLAKGQRVSFQLQVDRRSGLPRASNVKVHVGI